jgi:hypothetical protein
LSTIIVSFIQLLLKICGILHHNQFFVEQPSLQRHAPKFYHESQGKMAIKIDEQKWKWWFRIIHKTDKSEHTFVGTVFGMVTCRLLIGLLRY